MVEENGGNPVFVMDIIERKIFLERLLEFENLEIYLNIESNLSQKSTQDSKIDYLTSIFDYLQILLKRVSSEPNEDVILVENSLIQILRNLKDRYAKLLEFHPVFRFLIKESDATYFQNKDLKYSFYQDLYELAYTLSLIDDIETEEQDFINAFTSPKPETNESKVRFTANNYIVAYFLNSIKPFFNKFTRIAIEESKAFLNKQNKPITSKDLDTAMSRGKDKSLSEKELIDKYILNLKNRHLS